MSDETEEMPESDDDVPEEPGEFEDAEDDVDEDVTVRRKDKT